MKIVHQASREGTEGVQGVESSAGRLYRPVTRRKVLSSLLLTTAGAASLGVLDRPEVALASPVPNQTITRGGNTICIGPIRAADGFPQASIQGTFAGVSGNGAYCMVNAGDSVVPVTVMPSTQLLSGGAIWNGTVSPLSPGDNVFIFTKIVESGDRVAITIEQNPRLYKLMVKDMSASVIRGQTLSSDPTPGAAVNLLTNPLTAFSQLGAPAVGTGIRVATVSNAPVNPTMVYAMQINPL